MYINTINDHLRLRYGCKVYKLSLDGGFTCPNRDGTLGERGCIFCSGGSGSFAECGTDMGTQIEAAKACVRAKTRDDKYIAYFQSYTNTYAPVDRLDRLFSEAISHPDIVGLSIATRPDCLEDEKIALLKRLNKIKPVTIELGLQTVNEATARYIRRGYELPVFDDAMQRLRAAGLETVVHMIIGLPYETDEDIYHTAKYISKSGADGVKLQLLHILKGTDLAEEYAAEKFETLSLERYIELLIGCIRYLRRDIVIHRMTGDGDKRELIAPLWSGNKKTVLNAINRALRENDVTQGEWSEI